MSIPWQISPLGEAALLAEADTDDHAAANQAALAAAASIEAAALPGLSATVPAIASLLVCFDPLAVAPSAVEAQMRAALERATGATAAGRLVEIPVAYGGAGGPDLDEAARALGLTPGELVALHCAGPYRVMMIGFAPGYPYIGPMPPALRLPRRATPRSAVPPGTVAIAAGLSGIYPARLPGGWHLIGHTALGLFDPAAAPPALLAPGDLVRFVAVANL
jgi:KipI family sensor histidine kinase inhibitor